MIFITATFRVEPQDADAWPQISAASPRATRAEPGCPCQRSLLGEMQVDAAPAAPRP